jgi:very-short-patch-repair endonuclease
MGDEAFKKDVARDRHLSLLGWVILYFCWDDIVLAPERVRFETETALRNALNLPA